MRSQIVQPGAYVIAFPVTFVMGSSTLAHAAKVDAQGNQSGVIQGRRGAKDDFVMHRAAAQRVRMQYQSDTSNRTSARLFQNGFQPTVRCGYKKIACGIHVEIFDCRFVGCQSVWRSTLSLRYRTASGSDRPFASDNNRVLK